MIALSLLARIPLRGLYVLSSVFAFLLQNVVRYRARRVAENLRCAFPEKTESERKSIARAFYRNLLDLLLETVKASRMDETEFRERITLTNGELLDEYNAQAQPIIIVGSHQANWEWLFLACSLRFPFPLDAIYRPLHSAAFEDFVHTIRTRFGARLILDRVAFKTVMANLKEIRAVGLVADQRPGRKEQRHWTRFLNQDTAFHTGWARLAQFTKYPVLFARCERVARGRYELTFFPLGEPPYGSNVGPLIDAYADMLETAIVENPSSWLWTHNRWREKKPLYS